MRRSKTLLVSLGSTASLLAASAAAAQCLLANPNFESAGSGATVFAGWNQFGPVGSSPSAVHGSRSARVTGPHTGNRDVTGYWQSQDCVAGRRWSASVCVRHSGTRPLLGQSQALLNIEWRDGAGNLISYESHAAADASTPTDTWRVYSVLSQPAPAGTASIHFLLGVLQGPSDPTQEVLFDAATCVSLGPPTLESLQWNDFPSGQTLSFSGRTWRSKGPGFYGPGPNLFDNGLGAVSVDADGRLHLTIHKIGNSCYSSEAALVDPLGYDDYVFTTRGRLDLFDRNTVLGLFIWEYGSCFKADYLWWNPFNEIDVEFSRWGSAVNLDAQFVAQPASTPGNLLRFDATFGDGEVTSHAMRWLPDRVEFRSWRGGADAESPQNMIASWTYAGPNLPRREAPRVHLNLWQLATPTLAQEAVFEAFTFRPACPAGNCGILGVDPPADPIAPSTLLAGASPNPFVTETTIRFSLPVASGIDLSLFDITGRRVRRLAGGATGAGKHGTRWDGLDDAGHHVHAGVYLCRLSTPRTALACRIVVVE